MSDPIRDELHKLNEDFKKLLTSGGINVSNKTSPEHMAKFGLTVDEAKAWLESEPDFTPKSSDEFLHDRRNRRGLYRTLITTSTFDT